MITAIALILIGLALVAVEVYVTPGMNAIGIAGGLALVAGVVLAFVEAGSLGGIIAATGALGAGGAMFYVMWQTGALNHFVLADVLRTEPEAEREGDARSRYLGQSGIAVTPLRPGGIAEIEGERLDVQTEGGFIASGSRVRVVAMDRTRFFVRLDDAG